MASRIPSDGSNRPRLNNFNDWPPLTPNLDAFFPRELPKWPSLTPNPDVFPPQLLNWPPEPNHLASRNKISPTTSEKPLLSPQFPLDKPSHQTSSDLFKIAFTQEEPFFPEETLFSKPFPGFLNDDRRNQQPQANRVQVISQQTFPSCQTQNNPAMQDLIGRIHVVDKQEHRRESPKMEKRLKAIQEMAKSKETLEAAWKEIDGLKTTLYQFGGERHEDYQKRKNEVETAYQDITNLYLKQNVRSKTALEQELDNLKAAPGEDPATFQKRKSALEAKVQEEKQTFESQWMWSHRD